MSVIYELAIIIIVATIVAYLGKLIKQQIIPAYILAGFIIGPLVGSFLGTNGIISNTHFIKEISELGITFLLFIVGMEINLKKLKDVGLIAGFGTLIQFALIFVGGFALSSIFFGPTESIILGFTLAFGSTMVVIDTFTRNNEIDTLHGRISLGILLVQDIIAILAITLLSGISISSGGFETFIGILIAILKAFVMFIITVTAIRIMPLIFKFAAKSQELLFMCSISVAFIFALLAENIGRLMSILLIPLGMTPGGLIHLFMMPGLSTAIGGFLGGLAIGSLPYAMEISGKISSLKEFFATIFFVSLGMEIQIFSSTKILIPALVLLIFLVTIKPLIITFITALFGFEKRTSFITGISLFQVSEFAIIIDTLALSYGLISQEVFSLTILLAAITMILTSYSINYKNGIYRTIGSKIKYLHLIARKNEELQFLPKDPDKEVILLGFNRIGFSIYKTLRRLKKNFIILDFNPDTIKKLIKDKIHCVYGDAGDIETLDKLKFEKARIIISTIPDLEINKLVVNKARDENPNVIIFATAYHPDDALELYDVGADYVILPHLLGGEHVSFMLEDITTDLSSMIKHRFNHIFELKEREKHFGNMHQENI